VRVLKDTPFQFGFLTWQLHPPEVLLTVVVKATFDLPGDGECTVAANQLWCTGDVHYDGDFRQSVEYDTDLAPFKPRGECYLKGTCHAPAGRPTRVSGVRFEVGDVRKALAIFGDRAWGVASATEPEPFTAMPLRWERCFGGPDYPANPVGLGIARAGGRRPLPNIENPRKLIRGGDDRPEPHGLFPIPRAWPARATRQGTYDARWTRERWPHWPEDFNTAYFSACPDDQQIDGYFLGDEAITLQNLHPTYPRIEAWLPGLRARAGLVGPGEGAARAFREVPLALDTIVVDSDALRVQCTWRGMVAVQDAAASEYEYLFLAHDSIDDDALPEQLRARFDATLARKVAEESIPARPTPPVPTVLTVLEPFRAQLAKHELTPEMFAESMQRPPGRVNYDEARTRLARGRAALASAGLAEPPELATLGAEIDALERGAQRDAGRLRAQLLERIARGERSFVREQLLGADLSGLDLSGLDFSRARLAGANLAGADLSRAVLDEADLAGADLSRARLREASLRDCQGNGARAPEAVFDGARLDGASFEGAVLASATFVRARCVRARFVKSDLRQAVFVDAQAAWADFSRAQLVGVDFTRAVLADATLNGASAAGATLCACDLTRLRASDGANLTEANLAGARADGAHFRRAVLEAADLSYVDLRRANFEGANLAEALMNGCAMRHGNFRGASLVGVEMLETDAFEANFEGADLSHADVRGSNFFGAEFYRAVVEETQFERANLKRTSLWQS
jgi:uncharacterized protein YjbI with pentapeptide repeats